jgi:plastocyanin
MSGRGWGLALGLTVLTAAVSGMPAGAASKTVDMEAQSFKPKTVEISAGDKVVWKHQGGESHTVTADNRSFDSSPGCSAPLWLGCIDNKGDTYEQTFPDGGTFAYYCKRHGAPGGQGMSGVVVVKAKAATPSTTAPPSSASTTTTRPKASTTTTQASVTTTSRPLSTSSTVIRSTTTAVGEEVVEIQPNDPPAFDPEGGAAPAAKGSGKKGDSDTVPIIVALLLAVASAGGVLLWRLRPGR